MNRRRVTNFSAFTLLELILAMGMAAIISIVMYSAMYSAFRAKKSAEAAEYPTRVMGIVGDLISHDLEQAVRPNGVLAGSFVGEHSGSDTQSEDTLSFYCMGRDANDVDAPFSDGVRRVDLYVRTDVKPAVLVRDVYRNLLAINQEDPQQEVLCRGVESFSVQYYDGTNWTTDWDSTTQNNTMPLAVLVKVVANISDSSRVGGDSGSNENLRAVERFIPLAGGATADEAADTTSSGGTQ